MTLSVMAQHFFDLYGRRNRIFLPGLLERFSFLSLAISDLQEAIRKEVETPHREAALARLVSRVFCIAEHFYELPLVDAMARKYPRTHCGYCGQLPCACEEKRSEICLQDEIAPEQREWSLSQWCAHLGTLYGAKNKQRPQALENLLNRLSREVNEFLSLLMNLSHNGATLEEIEREYALELADTLAWVIAIANFLEVDLERAVLDRFVTHNCWSCHQKPCTCTHFNIKLVKWNEVNV